MSVARVAAQSRTTDAKPDVRRVRRGMEVTYGLNELPKPDKMREIAEPWRPYRSVGTWYMWRSLGVDVPEQGRGYKKDGAKA